MPVGLCLEEKCCHPDGGHNTVFHTLVTEKSSPQYRSWPDDYTASSFTLGTMSPLQQPIVETCRLRLGVRCCLLEIGQKTVFWLVRAETALPLRHFRPDWPSSYTVRKGRSIYFEQATQQQIPTSGPKKVVKYVFSKTSASKSGRKMNFTYFFGRSLKTKTAKN